MTVSECHLQLAQRPSPPSAATETGVKCLSHRRVGTWSRVAALNPLRRLSLLQQHLRNPGRISSHPHADEEISTPTVTRPQPCFAQLPSVSARDSIRP